MAKKSEWEITFAHGTKNKTFTRFVVHEHEAISEARDGFQAVYGYWPDEVIKAVRVREVE